MEKVQHFSHDHPLIFREDDDDNRYEKTRFCNGCGLPMLSSPSYSCSINGCDFFLHKPCYLLPLESNHISEYGRDHTLDLHAKPTYENCECSICDRVCKNFTYQCSTCEFKVDPFCEFSLEIKSQHQSHKHPLVFLRREAVLLCNACGTKHDGQFLSCQECSFWINQDCLLLPTIMETHEHTHPLTLTYSSHKITPFVERKCQICLKKLATTSWLYFCFLCFYYVHLRCALSKISKDCARPFVLLPPQVGTFFDSLIRTSPVMISEDNDEINIYKDGMLLDLKKCHEHPLIFHDLSETGIDGEILGGSSCTLLQPSSPSIGVCNACIKPIISPPFYRCSQSECHFFLHNFCSNLSSDIENGSFVRRLTLFQKAPKSHFSSYPRFFSVFRCNCCNLLCNGFAYHSIYKKMRHFLRVYSEFDLDVECALTPNLIKHQSHQQHFLFLVGGESVQTIQYHCCPFNSNAISAYKCSSCDFKIHVRCALLPKTVSHEFDKHHLQLMFGAPEPHSQEENYYFCEFCEKDIDPKFWFYGCVDCDQSFHVDCIPSVGRLSKIKFGGTLNLDFVHPHPLTLIRMVDVDSNICGICKKFIDGFVDDMAFQCRTCDFWIHFDCAKEKEEERQRWIIPPQKHKWIFPSLNNTKKITN